MPKHEHPSRREGVGIARKVDDGWVSFEKGLAPVLHVLAAEHRVRAFKLILDRGQVQIVYNDFSEVRVLEPGGSEALPEKHRHGVLFCTWVKLFSPAVFPKKIQIESFTGWVQVAKVGPGEDCLPIGGCHPPPFRMVDTLLANTHPDEEHVFQTGIASWPSLVEIFAGTGEDKGRGMSVKQLGRLLDATRHRWGPGRRDQCVMSFQERRGHPRSDIEGILHLGGVPVTEHFLGWRYRSASV